jgi:DNA-binding PucR family transcriptional regulator
MNYEKMLQANLERVFGERDASRRIEAISELYAEDAELYEPQHSANGYQAIAQAVTDLLAQLPADFTFTASRPALVHNGLGRLQWRAGPPEGPAVISGTDVAHFKRGLIQSLHVFVDQPDT